MPSLLSWLLPVFIFAVWGLWVVACAAQLQAENIRRGTPEGTRRGVSVLPAFPVFPLLCWAAMVLFDKWFQPWGTILAGGSHIIFSIALLVTTVRDIRFCRLHNGLQ